VVVVTVLDEEQGDAYNEAVKKNREAYAEKHGMIKHSQSRSCDLFAI
jgi:hypothetical protein